MMQKRQMLESFDGLEYGDEIVYIGPDRLGDNWAAPKDWKQPYTFRHISHGGTLSCYTRFNGKKELAPEHPANDPKNWRLATDDEVEDVTIIEDHGKWDWTLAVRDGEVIAGKAIPYDGALTYSTEDRYISRRKNSEYRLTPSEVVDRFYRESDTESAKDQLYADVMEALE